MNTGTTIQRYRIGAATVFRIVETALNGLTPERVFPSWDPSVLDTHADLLRANAGLDAAREHLLLNVNTWVIQLDGKTILVDTGIGNGKDRPFSALFHRLDNPYLERLTAAGVQADDVDYVLMTHLHVDHVGWNTRWNRTRWVPTFPRARYVFPAAERAFYATPAAANRMMVFNDSVAPLIEAGVVDEIPGEGATYLDGITFHPTPGHSPGHMSIALDSHGEAALFTGDIAHHAIQACKPEWSSMFCADPASAERSRRWAFDFGVDRHATLFTPHFPQTSAGKVIRNSDAYEWTYV